MLHEPISSGMLHPITSIKYPTTGVKAIWTNAFDASNAPNGPLSFSNVWNFLWSGLSETGLKSTLEFAELTLSALENK